MGPAMSWCLVQGCNLPSPIRSWDEVQHATCDPTRVIAVKRPKLTKQKNKTRQMSHNHLRMFFILCYTGLWHELDSNHISILKFLLTPCSIWHLSNIVRFIFNCSNVLFLILSIRDQCWREMQKVINKYIKISMILSKISSITARSLNWQMNLCWGVKPRIKSTLELCWLSPPAWGALAGVCAVSTSLASSSCRLLYLHRTSTLITAVLQEAHCCVKVEELKKGGFSLS